MFRELWAVSGALMLAVAAIVGLPWQLWIGWGYLGVLDLWERRTVPTERAAGRASGRRSGRSTGRPT